MNWDQPQPKSEEKVLSSIERLDKLPNIGDLLENLMKAKQELKDLYSAGEETGSYDHDKIDQINEQKEKLENELELIVGNNVDYDDDVEEITKKAIWDIFEKAREIPEIRLDVSGAGFGHSLKIFPNGMAISRDMRDYEDMPEYHLYKSDEVKNFLQKILKDREEEIKSRQEQIKELSGIVSEMK